METYPHYSLPTRFWTSFFIDALSGRKRSFQSDSRLVIPSLQPALEIRGTPIKTPNQGILLFCNHYSRPGFPTYWLAFAIASCWIEEIHWMMTSTFTYDEHPLRFLLKPLSKWFLAKIANVYKFTLTPPISAFPVKDTNRVIALRELMAFSRAHPNATLGIAPEGRDFLGGVLGTPPRGAGKLIHQLVRMGFQPQAVGVFEEKSRLVVNFGNTFEINAQHCNNAAEIDRSTSDQVMHRIAALLPEHLRGKYR